MNFCFVVETGHSLAWVGTWGQTHDPVNTALRTPGASAVIYGGVEAKGIVFDGVADALRVPALALYSARAKAAPRYLERFAQDGGQVTLYDVLYFIAAAAGRRVSIILFAAG